MPTAVSTLNSVLDWYSWTMVASRSPVSGLISEIDKNQRVLSMIG